MGMQAAVEQWVRSESKGVVGSLLATPPSLLYSFFVKMRNWGYEKSFFEIKRAPIPVVSVGNLIAGGAGKTTLVAHLAKTLMAIKGCKVALISRGYRAPLKKGGSPVVVSYGAGPCVGWQEAGDEAYLLASTFKEAIVISGRDRLEAVGVADRLGAHIALLDDGMQYRRIFRNGEVVALDANNPFGGGYFLPRGLLRDDPERLEHADLVAIIGSRVPSEIDKRNWVRFERRALGVRAVNGLPIEIKARRVALFSGIANPAGFRRSIESLGATVVSHLVVADHKAVSFKLMNRFANKMAGLGAEVIIGTEKDWIKLKDEPWIDNVPLIMGYLECELVLEEHKEVWHMWVEKMKEWLVL